MPGKSKPHPQAKRRHVRKTVLRHVQLQPSNNQSSSPTATIKLQCGMKGCGSSAFAALRQGGSTASCSKTTSPSSQCNFSLALADRTGPVPGMPSWLKDEACKNRNCRRGDFIYPHPFYTPSVEYLNTTVTLISDEEEKPVRCSGDSLLSLEHLSNPILVFGDPFSGKTSLFTKLVEQTTTLYGRSHWIRLMEMKYWAAQFRSSKSKMPRTFMELLSMQLNVSEDSLRRKFRPLSNYKQLMLKEEYSKLIRGELFLDGFDEIPPIWRGKILELLATTKEFRSQCPIRIWISCRNHLKAQLIDIFGDRSAFEVMKFPRCQQIDMFYKRFKHAVPDIKNVQQDKLKDFTVRLYLELEALIKDFEKSIGSTPLFLEIISNIFRAHVKSFVENYYTYTAFDMNPAELFGQIVVAITEYCLLKSRPADPIHFEGLKREFDRITQMHATFAVLTFPTYEVGVDFDFNKILQRDEELLCIGLVVRKENGALAFINKIFGDFFLGKYYAYPEIVDSRDCLSNNFFFGTLLMNEEAKSARSFLDKCIHIGSEYKSTAMCDFLLKHYKLRKEDREHWELIKDKGNVWHLAVAEGFPRIAGAYRSSLLIGPDEVFHSKKFFRMRAPVQISHHSREDSENDLPAELHIVSCLSMLGLFGSNMMFMRMSILHLLELFGTKEIQKELNQQGTWTPFHYAAMHSNLWLFGELFSCGSTLLVKPGVWNPKGELPLHFLMSYSWHHQVIIQYNIELSKVSVEEVKSTDLKHCEMAVPEEIKGVGNLHRKRKLLFKPGTQDVISSEKNKCPCSSKSQVSILTSQEGSPSTTVLCRDMTKDFSGLDMNQHKLLLVHLECIRHLIVDLNEDINAGVQGSGLTILHQAAKMGQVDSVMLLLQLGADLHRVDEQGKTPLHHAALHGRRWTFMYLVKFGAHIFAKDDEGNTPIQLWREIGEAIDRGRGKPMLEREKAFFKLCLSFLDFVESKPETEEEEEDDSEEVEGEEEGDEYEEVEGEEEEDDSEEVEGEEEGDEYEEVEGEEEEDEYEEVEGGPEEAEDEDDESEQVEAEYKDVDGEQETEEIEVVEVK